MSEPEGDRRRRRRVSAHEHAAAVHDQAAVMHEGAAAFFENHGMPDAAVHERHLAADETSKAAESREAAIADGTE